MPRGNSKNLTVVGLRKLKPPEEGRREVFDAKVPGLFIRITAKGSRSWGLDYRFQGQRRRYMIGSYPSVDLEEARNTGEDLRAKVRQGIDPAAEKRAAKNRGEAPDTIEKVAGIFVERHAKKNRSWRETVRIFEKYVFPYWGKRPIREIRRADVIDLLDRMEDRHGVVMADRVLAVIRKMFNWAIERDLVEVTPVVRGMGRSKPRERQRERWLRDDEIRLVWQGAEGLGYPFGPFVQLLLATGQRPGEVANMRWDEINGGLWVIPGAKTKNKKEHEVPLTGLALNILARVPHTGDYVFESGRSRSGRPISGFSKTRKRLDEMIGVHLAKETNGAKTALDPWVFHDLRRTVRTNLAALGISKEVADKVVNHTDQSISAVYDRHRYGPEKRQALEAWEARLRQIIGAR